MPLVTKSELEKAHENADAWNDATNGGSNTTVETPDGRIIKSLSKLAKEYTDESDARYSQFDNDLDEHLAQAISQYIPTNRGPWQPNTSYEVNDAWKYADSWYLTLTAYVSSAATAEDDISGGNVVLLQQRRLTWKTDSLSVMRSLTPVEEGQTIALSEVGRAGMFVYREGDYSAQVSADPEEGIYVATTSDPAGSGGVWKRFAFTYVTPEMFGGGEAGFKAALASGYPIRDGSDTYEMSSVATLPAGQILSGLKVTGSNTENVRHGADSSETVLFNVTIDCPTGIALHHNQPNSSDNFALLCRMRTNGYGFLSNNAADGSDGYVVAFSEIYSRDADGVELNHPDEDMHHFSIIGNLIETGNVSTSSTAGFAIGVAGTQGYVLGLNHLRMSRREAVHIEDGQRRGVVIGNTALTEEHGVLILPPKGSDGAANGPIVVANHMEEMTGEAGSKNGLYTVYNENGSIASPVFVANALEGFSHGLQAGSGRLVVADSNVFKNVSVGIGSYGSHIEGTNVVEGECGALLRAYAGTVCGKIVTHSAPTNQVLLPQGSLPEIGPALKGFKFRKSASHTGGDSIQSVCTLPVELLYADRLVGRMTLYFPGQYHAFWSANILWDGSTLTTTDKAERYYGTISSVSLPVENSQLVVSMYSEEEYSSLMTVDFDGVYYRSI